jgi:hypothetical protein
MIKDKFMRLTDEPMGEDWCYFYLHTNGELIQKNKNYTPDGIDFNESPFCIVYWKMDKVRRFGLYEVLIAAAISGAKKTSIEKMAEIHGATDLDAMEYCRKARLKCIPIENQGEFNFRVSYDLLPGEGLGITVLDAIIDFTELCLKTKKDVVM